MNSVEQGCPILFLEIYLPAKFSPNPDETLVKQLQEHLIITDRCVDQGWI